MKKKRNGGYLRSTVSRCFSFYPPNRILFSFLFFSFFYNMITLIHSMTRISCHPFWFFLDNQENKKLIIKFLDQICNFFYEPSFQFFRENGQIYIIYTQILNVYIFKLVPSWLSLNILFVSLKVLIPINWLINPRIFM